MHFFVVEVTLYTKQKVTLENPLETFDKSPKSCLQTCKLHSHELGDWEESPVSQSPTCCRKHENGA